jgi:hypothetical protein
MEYIDYITDCNELGLTVKEFEQVWCIRCNNRECRRVGKGNLWARRMQHQVHDLLIDPPRADPNDPKYEGINKQHFESVNPQSGVPTVTYPIAEIGTAPTKFVGEGQVQETPRIKEMFVKPGAIIKMG